MKPALLKGFVIMTCALPCWRGTSLWAQLNESDTAAWQLRAGLTGAWQQGNVELLTLRTRAEWVTNGRRALVGKSQQNWLYQEFGNRKADSDFNSRNYLYYKPLERWYPFAFAHATINFRRQIDYRWFAGAGGTRQVIRTPRHNLKLAGSLVFEQTRFARDEYNEQAYDGSRNISLWRATAWIAGWHQLAGQRARLYYSAYWQPGITRENNFRAQMEAGLDFPVYRGFSLQVMYLYTHEQVVVKGVRQHDGILTFGINYQHRRQ